MNKTIKIILLIVFTGIIGIGFYAYTSFNGVPWKKAQVAKELERYIEDQYNTDVEVVDKFYNFKFDHYGAEFKGTHDETEFIFRAEKTFRGINHYYIEGLWEWQLREVAEPIVHDYIERLSIDDYSFLYLGGIAKDLNIQPDDIPHYTELDSQLDLIIHLDYVWDEQNKENGLDGAYSFIKELKNNGVESVNLMIVSQWREEGHTYTLKVKPGELKNIQTRSDVENYLFLQ